ncbi:MAG TPA: response regulator [Vicinamibacteria bacterium]
MRCPKCRSPITTAPDPGGFLICPGCGARLTTRPAKPPERGAANPNATLPPGTPLKKIPRPGEDTAKSAGVPGAPAAPPKGGGAVPPPPGAREGGTPATLEAVLAELRALRRGQEEMLRLLRREDAPPSLGSFEELDDDSIMPALLPPVRSQQRKSVLVIDDDPQTREASVLELQAADVPVRAFPDGQSAFEAMARDKPDVIALELDLRGSLAGKDVINMIKATMEWVDIPLILYTRAPVESQRDARQVHGADDVVLKRSGPAALVSKVVALFRRA